MNARKPVALVIGRFQPLHDGHKALIREALSRVGQVLIAVKDATESDPDNNPERTVLVMRRICAWLDAEQLSDRCTVVCIGNVTHVFHGRDVGYAIERIHLTPELEAIRGRDLR